jgi:hypothetical protein
MRTYELTTEWTVTATVYSGMTLKWDYNARTCDISMPGYVSNIFSKSQHDAPMLIDGLHVQGSMACNELIY